MNRYGFYAATVGLYGSLLTAIGVVSYAAVTESYWSALVIFPLLVAGVGITALTRLGWEMVKEDERRNKH